MKRVLLAEPDPILRRALSLMLQRRLGVRQITEITNSDDLKAAPYPGPGEVMFVNWRQSPLHEPSELAKIRQHRPDMRVIALCIRPEDGPQALQSGAHSYIDQGASPEIVLKALEMILHEPAS